MARKRLIWHLYPAFLALGMTVLLAVTLYAAHSFRLFYYRHIEEDLEARAHLVKVQFEPVITSGTISAIDDLCKSLGRQSNTRITIILPEGRVAGDSQEKPADMQDHGDRPEFIEAMKTGLGRSVRFSSTLGKNMMYLAIPVRHDGEVSAVIRMALPVTEIEQELNTFYGRVAWAVALLIVFAAVVSFYLSKKISRPIEQMKDMASRYAAGDFSQRLMMPSAAESAELSETLNEMARQLKDRIETITQEKNRIQAILSSMLEGVMALDSEGRIVDLNKAAAAYLGIDERVAIGRSIEETVRNPQFQQFVQSTLAQNDPLTETELVLMQDGHRYLQLHGTGLGNGGGKRAGAVVVMHDMTQIHRLEQVRRDFVANVSHELKTPITSIKGFVETLQEGAIENPPEARRFLEIIARHADRLNAIVDDLLSLSRLEEDSENRSLFFERSYLKPAIASAVELAGFKAEKKQISVELSCGDEITVKMNSALIEQAILNLVDNAIKYSPNHSTICVSVQPLPAEVVISVTDQGSGIPQEHLGRIFERFYVVDRGRSRKLGGTGLGLSIVKHIAQVHGGRIEVTSIEGRGSTFQIYLPADGKA